MARVEALIETRARRVAVIAHPAGFERLGSVLRSVEEVEVVRIDPDDAAVALRAVPYDLAVVALDRFEIDPFATLRDLVTEEVVRDLPLIAYVPGRAEQARAGSPGRRGQGGGDRGGRLARARWPTGPRCTCTELREPCRARCAACWIA